MTQSRITTMAIALMLAACAQHGDSLRCEAAVDNYIEQCGGDTSTGRPCQYFRYHRALCAEGGRPEVVAEMFECFYREDSCQTPSDPSAAEVCVANAIAQHRRPADTIRAQAVCRSYGSDNCENPAIWMYGESLLLSDDRLNALNLCQSSRPASVCEAEVYAAASSCSGL